MNIQVLLIVIIKRINYVHFNSKLTLSRVVFCLSLAPGIPGWSQLIRLLALWLTELNS